MSQEQPASAGPGQGSPPSEEELRAQLEEELRRVKVRDVLLQTVVSLVNLGGQRLGLAPDARDTRDLGQARMAIEAVRVLLPLLEEEHAEQVRPVRDALSQLQLAYAREAGAPAAGAPSESSGAPPRQDEAGTQQKPGGDQPTRRAGARGGLWIPPGSAG